MICTRLLTRKPRPNLTALKSNLTSLRNLATRPRKGNVVLYQMKWDKPWVFGAVGTGLTSLGVAGTFVVQQMIKVHLGEDSLRWRLGFVTACTAALIAFNMFALRTTAKLQYNGTLNKLELTRVGACGIRQTVHLTPRLGTVTFVERENKLVVKHPDSRFSHSLNLRLGDLYNEQLYEKLFGSINER
ncbi:hypothetical protein ACHWQZ_G003983 [Mnemiopsis leidyi]